MATTSQPNTGNTESNEEKKPPPRSEPEPPRQDPLPDLPDPTEVGEDG
jgi:hypothetical protein